MTTEHFRYPEKEENTKLESIYKYLRDHSGEVELWQDTEDIAQLDPMDRLRSIESVWDASSHLVGKPEKALDLGAGFGYGLIFLETVGVKAVGIESVQHKINQGVTLFEKTPVPLKVTDSIDFQNTPAILHGDVMDIKVSDQNKVDLVTAFYLSGEMVNNPLFLSNVKSFLRTDGKLLLATHVSAEEAEQWLERNHLMDEHTLIIQIPDNFEKTVVILGF